MRVDNSAWCPRQAGGRQPAWRSLDRDDRLNPVTHASAPEGALMDDQHDESDAPRFAAAVSGSSVETFSDGVFAIAITLLVLDIAVPAREGSSTGRLANALAHQWPSYFAYLVSFLVIGIIWVNHHTVFVKVRVVDRYVLFANLALLLTISVIPFPTRLMAEYLTAGTDAHTAAAVYSATMLAMGQHQGLTVHDDTI
jgi:uncharacterized membrane protein